MAQIHFRSYNKVVVWFLRKAQRRCWKSVRWQCPTYDQQFPVRNTATPFETITQLSLSGKLLHISKEIYSSMVWRMMGNWIYPKWQPYLQMIINRTLNKINSYAITVRNKATFLEILKNRSKEMILRSKTQKPWHLDHFHPILNANDQIIPQKNAGAVPKPLKDPNRLNGITQPKIEMMGKNKENRPIQDLYQFPKTP